jgi:hypothetical protein
MEHEREGDSMAETNDALWLAFEALAKKYPHDHGVRVTADLARWLLEESQRVQLAAPPTMRKALQAIAQQMDMPAALAIGP